MEGADLLLAGVLFLFSAVVAVPLAARLGIGAVLGYLLAGIAIGPWGLGFISDVDEILHFSELGVVFLMFIIGLELNPSKLWRLRSSIFGVGAAQVVLSAGILGGLLIVTGFSWQAAVIGGIGLAMSSTAMALQLMRNKGMNRSEAGQLGFSVLLFQDLAVVPLLILLPLAVMLFRRTLREVAVAVAGLLLPALTLCYVNWAAGGEFLAPVAEPGSAFIAGTPLSLFLSTPVQNLVLPGAVFLLDLTALLFFLSDIYALGTKPRLIFIFNISALLLTAAALCGPAATPATVALAAVPSAVLLPFMFVRIHRAIALPLYLLLLASAVISAVLQ